MKATRFFMCVVIVAVFSMCLTPYADAETGGKWNRLVENTGRVLSEVQQMPDTSIPSDLLSKSAAIAIFPDTVSAGFGIGGKYGQGIIIARNEKTGEWTGPAIFTIAGGSFGMQIGGQATDIILLIMNRRSVEALLQGKFKLGVDAAVSAGPVGRDAQAATDAKLGGILSYSRSRGLFAGIKLEGDVIAAAKAGNKTLYGGSLTPEDVLLDGKGTMPESADKLLSVLKQYPYKK